MKLLDDYLELQKQIYDYFGYIEDCMIIPIDDRRNYYWSINNDRGKVHFAHTRNLIIRLIKFNYDWVAANAGDGYSNEIYPQRFFSKGVYHGKDFTMICVDTNTDGNKFLAIYSNEKEVK